MNMSWMNHTEWNAVDYAIRKGKAQDLTESQYVLILLRAIHQRNLNVEELYDTLEPNVFYSLKADTEIKPVIEIQKLYALNLQGMPYTHTRMNDKITKS